MRTTCLRESRLTSIIRDNDGATLKAQRLDYYKIAYGNRTRLFYVRIEVRDCRKLISGKQNDCGRKEVDSPYLAYQ